MKEDGWAGIQIKDVNEYWQAWVTDVFGRYDFFIFQKQINLLGSEKYLQYLILVIKGKFHVWNKAFILMRQEQRTKQIAYRYENWNLQRILWAWSCFEFEKKLHPNKY